MHALNFYYYVVPNSMARRQSNYNKLVLLQLQKTGFPLDPWTLAELYEIDNFGAPPAGNQRHHDPLYCVDAHPTRTRAGDAGRDAAKGRDTRTQTERNGQSADPAKIRWDSFNHCRNSPAKDAFGSEVMIGRRTGDDGRGRVDRKSGSSTLAAGVPAPRWKRSSSVGD